MKKESIGNRDKKRISFLLFRIVGFLIPSFTVLSVISFHSDYLFKKVFKYIFLIFLIICIGLLVYSIIIFIKNKEAGKVSKRKSKVIFSLLLPLYVILCAGFLFVLYGPITTFRDWLITTAMQTMHHQYICKIFYSEEEINKTLSNNYIIEIDEQTDTSLINSDYTYENEYDRQILERDNKDQLYKIIRFQVNGQDAYLAAIYDPSRVHVVYTKWLDKWGQYVTQMASEHEAPLAINGGGFKDVNYNSNGQTPIGLTMSYGKVITNDYGPSNSVIGITEDNVLVLMKGADANSAKSKGVRDAVTMGPFLIVNGKPSFVKGNGGWGYAARTAIGQRKDGIILFLVVDSNETRTKGASMVDLTEIMQNYGAVNAANLDGGTSSVMVENYEIINDPIDSALRHKTRPIATSIIVK